MLFVCQEMRDSAKALAKTHVDKYGVKRATGDKKRLRESQSDSQLWSENL